MTCIVIGAFTGFLIGCVVVCAGVLALAYTDTMEQDMVDCESGTPLQNKAPHDYP